MGKDGQENFLSKESSLHSAVPWLPSLVLIPCCFSNDKKPELVFQ